MLLPRGGKGGAHGDPDHLLPTMREASGSERLARAARQSRARAGAMRPRDRAVRARGVGARRGGGRLTRSLRAGSG